MKNFTESSNVIMLHHLLSGMQNVHEIPYVEWIDVPEHQRKELHDMVRDALTKEIDDWYGAYWRNFPFGKSDWSMLTLLQRDLVEFAFEQCNMCAALYGERVRDE